MLDPHELYQLADELPTLDRPVLVQALTGFVDAGGAARLAREHLLATRDSQPIATFDIDQLLDYRSRRPAMLFVEDHWESYDEPELQLHAAAATPPDTPFLLLAGPEPDLQWERFTAAVTGPDRAVRRPADGRPQRDPDGGAAHPADRRDRARHPAAT